MQGMHRVLIDMWIPDEEDHSRLLERAQVLSLEIAEEHFDDYLDDAWRDAIEGDVTVTPAPEDPGAAIGRANHLAWEARQEVERLRAEVARLTGSEVAE